MPRNWVVSFSEIYNAAYYALRAWLTHNGRGHLDEENKDWTKAIEIRSDTIMQLQYDGLSKPCYLENILFIAQYYAEQYFFVGQYTSPTSRHENDLREIECYTKAINVLLDENENQQDSLQFHRSIISRKNLLALAYWQRGSLINDYSSKISDWSKAVEICPDNVAFLYGRAIEMVLSNNFQSAIKDLTEVIRLAKSYNYTTLYQVMHPLDYSLKILPGRKEDTKYWLIQAYGSRGFAKSKLGDKDGALLDKNKEKELKDADNN